MERRTPPTVTMWEVRRNKDGSILGVVMGRRLWFEAREEACQRYGVDRGDIEVTLLTAEPMANGIQKKKR